MDESKIAYIPFENLNNCALIKGFESRIEQLKNKYGYEHFVLYPYGELSMTKYDMEKVVLFKIVSESIKSQVSCRSTKPIKHMGIANKVFTYKDFTDIKVCAVCSCD